jgi:hypothetical protein
VRRVGRGDLDYIGQTGLNLRARLGMLVGVRAPEMPYRDPHTAGPALWALRHATGCAFEASVARLDGPANWRKGWEAVAIALYRQAHGRSPAVNFGRMPAGYRMSSGNNARLVGAGRRFRGGSSDATDPSHAGGVPPTGSLEGDPQDSTWCGHRWSPWAPLVGAGALLPPDAVGLYRIRGNGEPTPAALVYVGEGRVRNRLAAHLGKTASPATEQGSILRAAAPLEGSWVLNGAWPAHQRLELETDLIAAHLLTTGLVPPAQFLG